MYTFNFSDIMIVFYFLLTILFIEVTRCHIFSMFALWQARLLSSPDWNCTPPPYLVHCSSPCTDIVMLLDQAGQRVELWSLSAICTGGVCQSCATLACWPCARWLFLNLFEIWMSPMRLSWKLRAMRSFIYYSETQYRRFVLPPWKKDLDIVCRAYVKLGGRCANVWVFI